MKEDMENMAERNADVRVVDWNFRRKETLRIVLDAILSSRF